MRVATFREFWLVWLEMAESSDFFCLEKCYLPTYTNCIPTWVINNDDRPQRKRIILHKVNGMLFIIATDTVMMVPFTSDTAVKFLKAASFRYTCACIINLDDIPQRNTIILHSVKQHHLLLSTPQLLQWWHLPSHQYVFTTSFRHLLPLFTLSLC